MLLLLVIPLVIVAIDVVSLQHHPDRVRVAIAFVLLHELCWCWNNIPTHPFMNAVASE